MKNLVTRLIRDDSGVILSTELVTISTITVVGMVVGLSGMASAVNSELNDVAGAIGAVNQSYNYNGLVKFGHAFVSGAGYNDRQDFCDCNPIVSVSVCGKSGAGFGPENASGSGGGSVGSGGGYSGGSGYSGGGGAVVSGGSGSVQSTQIIESPSAPATATQPAPTVIIEQPQASTIGQPGCAVAAGGAGASTIGQAGTGQRGVILSEEIVECPGFGASSGASGTTTGDDVASLRSLLQRISDQLGQHDSAKISPIPEPEIRKPMRIAPPVPKSPRDTPSPAKGSTDLPSPRNS